MARELSGGEQQMLAIGRALLGNPRLLIMDEPSEGLAPTIVEMLVDTFKRLEADGLPILLIEQKLDVATSLANRQLIMVGGEIAPRDDRSRSRGRSGPAEAVPRRRAGRALARSPRLMVARLHRARPLALLLAVVVCAVGCGGSPAARPDLLLVSTRDGD